MSNLSPEDSSRSLNWLLGWAPGKPPHPTPLVGRAEEALATPLNELTVEQIRLLIAQGLGLELVLPKALALLQRDLFVSGDFFDGDLLLSCLKISGDFWEKNPDLWVDLNALLTEFDEKVDLVNEHRGVFFSHNPFGARQ